MTESRGAWDSGLASIKRTLPRQPRFECRPDYLALATGNSGILPVSSRGGKLPCWATWMLLAGLAATAWLVVSYLPREITVLFRAMAQKHDSRFESLFGGCGHMASALEGIRSKLRRVCLGRPLTGTDHSVSLFAVLRILRSEKWPAPGVLHNLTGQA